MLQTLLGNNGIVVNLANMHPLEIHLQFPDYHSCYSKWMSSGNSVRSGLARTAMTKLGQVEPGDIISGKIKLGQASPSQPFREFLRKTTIAPTVTLLGHFVFTTRLSSKTRADLGRRSTGKSSEKVSGAIACSFA